MGSSKHDEEGWVEADGWVEAPTSANPSPEQVDAIMSHAGDAERQKKATPFQTVASEVTQGASKEWADEGMAKLYGARDYLRHLVRGDNTVDASVAGEKSAAEVLPQMREHREYLRNAHPAYGAGANLIGNLAGDYVINSTGVGKLLNNPLVDGALTGAGASEAPLASWDTAKSSTLGALMGHTMGKAAKVAPLRTAAAGAAYGLTTADNEADRWSALFGAAPAVANKAISKGAVRAANKAKATYDENKPRLDAARSEVGQLLVNEDHELGLKRHDPVKHVDRAAAEVDAETAKSRDAFLAGLDQDAKNAVSERAGNKKAIGEALDTRVKKEDRSERFETRVNRRVEGLEGKAADEAASTNEMKAKVIERANAKAALRAEKENAKALRDHERMVKEQEKARQKYAEATEEANRYEAKIPMRVANKENAVLGSRLERIVKSKAFGQDVSEDFKGDIDGYVGRTADMKGITPKQVMSDFVAEADPAAAGKAHGERLRAAHKKMIGDVEKNRPMEGPMPAPPKPVAPELQPMPEPVGPTPVDPSAVRDSMKPVHMPAEDRMNPNFVLKQAGLYDQAQVFPEYAKTQITQKTQDKLTKINPGYLARESFARAKIDPGVRPEPGADPTTRVSNYAEIDAKAQELMKMAEQPKALENIPGQAVDMPEVPIRDRRSELDAERGVSQEPLPPEPVRPMYPNPLHPDFGPEPMDKRIDARVQEKVGDQARAIDPKKLFKDFVVDQVVNRAGGKGSKGVLPPEMRAHFYGQIAKASGDPKYGRVLQNAAARGDAAVMAQVRMLLASDPDFKELWERGGKVLVGAGPERVPE